MNKGLAVTLAALLLTGCSSGDGEAKPKASPKPTVSLQTTCDRLFTQGDPRLWSRATSLVAAQSQGENVDESEVQKVHDDLTTIAGTSESSIRPHIETMADTVAHLDSADTSTYKTAATEVANQCTPYVALD